MPTIKPRKPKGYQPKVKPIVSVRAEDLANIDANAPLTRQREDHTKGRYLGTELRESFLSGKSKVNLNPNNYRPPTLSDRTKRAHDTMLAKSPLFLDALRRRLSGHHIGGTTKTVEDRHRFDELQTLKDRFFLQSIQAKKDKHQSAVNALKNATGVVSKGLSALKLLGMKFTGIVDKVKDAFDAIRPDKLLKQLAGLGLVPKKKMPRTGSGNTPYQSRKMIGVSSSNVTSVGWEPNNPTEKTRRNTQGMLFIEFRNGWMYKYANAPYWLYEAILRSPSKGRAVWALIRRGLFPDSVPYGQLGRDGYERIR